MVDRLGMTWWVCAGLCMALVPACGDDGSGDSTTAATTTTGLTTTTDPSVPTTTEAVPTTGTPDSTTEMMSSESASGSTTEMESTGNTTEMEVLPCGGCPANFICKYDTCIPDLGPCRTFDDCPGDSYCDADGQCIPYGVPEDMVNDPDCQKENVPEGVTPVMQCEWTGPGNPQDPTNGSTLIYTTPIIADLNLDKDPNKLQPSIIVTTFQTIAPIGRIGTLRVFDGRTCTEQMRAGGADEPNDANRPAYAITWAVGDLDNDIPDGGHPEIVGFKRVTQNNQSAPLSLYAMRVIFDAEDNPQLERMWYGRDCMTDTLVQFADQNALAGPLLQDLDNDDYPEILVGEMVFDHNGCLMTEYKNFSGNIANQMYMPITADVDLDGRPDLLTHNRTAEWDPLTTEWIDKPWFTANPAAKIGLYGVADAGLYSQVDGLPSEDLPEVVVVSMTAPNSPANDTGTIRVQSIAGETVWGPVDLYRVGNQAAGRGGPPTIADFDGDGQVEFASAGSTYYAVYDPDCVAALNGESPPERPGGKCDRSPDQAAKNLPDGVLWVQPSQDASSSITGSSIFDFNGDGKAEAVYRDECYVRVYDGSSGAVIFSAPASSGTGMEYASIADVDGDFATEIVVPRTAYNNCPAVDPLFPESGNFVARNGFVIYRDPQDFWANSRPIWNQHAYWVTNVSEDGRIPRAGEYVNNWQTEGLNNFRQNSQGGFGVLQIADLTVKLADLGSLCDLRGGTKELQAEVCNRGTNPVQDGVKVVFLETDDVNKPVEEAVIVCSTETTKLLMPGECEVVSCTGEIGGQGSLYVEVDPDQEIADCHPGNNLGAGTFAVCPG